MNVDCAQQLIAQNFDLAPRPLLCVSFGMEWLADCAPLDAAIDDAWGRYIRAFSEEQDRQMMDRNPFTCEPEVVTESSASAERRSNALYLRGEAWLKTLAPHALIGRIENGSSEAL